MKRPVLLPRLRLTLRWMFRNNPSLGRAVLITAELAAREDLGPSAVVNAIIDRHGNHLTAGAVLEIAHALEVDLPLDDLGAAVFDCLRLQGERRLVQ
jgi:hypothetical protein